MEWVVLPDQKLNSESSCSSSLKPSSEKPMKEFAKIAACDRGYCFWRNLLLPLSTLGGR